MSVGKNREGSEYLEYFALLIVGKVVVFDADELFIHEYATVLIGKDLAVLARSIFEPHFLVRDAAKVRREGVED